MRKIICVAMSLVRCAMLGAMPGCAVIGISIVGIATPARAAFHLWQITELYTDSSGTLQYIELFTADTDQQFVSGQQFNVSNVGGTEFHTFTVPSNLPGDSANHSWLIGTANISLYGAPTPDFVIPDNFLFIGGGSISFFGTPSFVSYSALPTDGILAQFHPGGATGLNSPRNFAGGTGMITGIPEPSAVSALAVVSIATMALFAIRKTARFFTGHAFR